ncbi:MAG: SDR family NAD(P)-dependent oxidoreductase [Chromatiales bacterium]|jgi:NAD(P)-dependent dehydrogenase (short-subunit alcohol dehydrogenase family)
MRLQDKVCYVTGAASGIGEAIARRFLDEGARVALVDRNADLLERVARTLGSGRHDRVKAFAIDVRDDADVGDTLAETAAAWSRIDVGVNSAGTLGPVGRLHEIDPGDYRELVDNNLHGVFNCLRHQLAHMSRAGRGSIVNISSAAGLVGFPTAAAYTAAKHGVVGLTRTCAIDYAGDNVRVNAIAPGGVDTPLIRATTCATAEGRAMIESLHPMRRLADPAEIASAALFLASDEASFVTGEIFSVDGGWLAW